jgi:hypothetical protein
LVQGLVKTFSRRLQIQERLTQQLASAVHEHAGMPLLQEYGSLRHVGARSLLRALKMTQGGREFKA